ncbi:uncharacterized protein Bfra_006871 [Botrytis fragariae]|uniref:Uncharacterized protein n=1 Tax=Botrytis fragariae TaxID=1964551 RepID=A0A8H6B5K7_9HELO|nr:uncharacterized protein Bfra_006871 [Botrytis fragariae]KAF5879664.1 hypothetical protein Bfra_006871 [Botrytis fragariae]
MIPNPLDNKPASGKRRKEKGRDKEKGAPGVMEIKGPYYITIWQIGSGKRQQLNCGSMRGSSTWIDK